MTRRIGLILGDQLDHGSTLLKEIDKASDRFLMLEVRQESTHPPSHKMRTALFLSAMRHHALWLIQRGWDVSYCTLDEPHAESFETALLHYMAEFPDAELWVTEPGDHKFKATIESVCQQTQTSLTIVEDTHFMCSLEEFKQWRSSRKSLVMETFYREMRKRHDILMEGKNPISGQWNFDKENRGSFGKEGPGWIDQPTRFDPDDITINMAAWIEESFPENPGKIEQGLWPVTREQALQRLDEFVNHHLVSFGQYQDAMWTDEPFLYHSLISSSLNLKLLNPREVIKAAVAAYEKGHAPLAAVEGFVRQILGWREYVRGIYMTEGPDYIHQNALAAKQPLPAFYWTADTEMNCLHHAIKQTLDTGYAHHIQRLMVTGLFGLLYGVKPQALHEWYLGIYVDAVEWVESPNTIGMSQYADGGLLASKPYAASGRYIDKISNYCKSCCYKPGEAVGEKACPFTTLYWDFLDRHEERFSQHPRAGMQWRMLGKLDNEKRAAIKVAAEALRQRFNVAQPVDQPKKAAEVS